MTKQQMNHQRRSTLVHHIGQLISALRNAERLGYRALAEEIRAAITAKQDELNTLL